ncbi:unnamed protein product [Porites lobata]|uniref:Uncharacterized protein n=1 Tax=Porites lobata TaxID=104759 RepID=A0ABN8MTH3_9CNID|nr:unnamed protein product [Porites lobata]
MKLVDESPHNVPGRVPCVLILILIMHPVSLILEERRRERKFYKDRQIPYPVPRACQALSVPGPSNAVKKQTASLPKKISKPKPLQKKYMRLSTQVTIGLIQRFLDSKLHLESANMVGILFEKTEMGKDLTLKYIIENL